MAQNLQLQLPSGTSKNTKEKELREAPALQVEKEEKKQADGLKKDEDFQMGKGVKVVDVSISTSTLPFVCPLRNLPRQLHSRKKTKKTDLDPPQKNKQSFDDMGLKEDLLRGIYNHGFDKPSGIQQRAILPILQGRDTIGQAQSGTGKTAAFCLSALNIIDSKLKGCQVLVLSPTRQLALQTYRRASAWAIFMEDVNLHGCVGGTNFREDIKKLSDGAQMVIGTPGRLNHMISDGYLDLSKLKLFILDEADEMLSFGFKEQIYEIFQVLPKDVQVALFSATMPLEILELTKKFMRDPCEILVKKEKITLDGIKQYFVAVEKEDFKLATLKDLYESLTISQAMIFCNTRRKVDWLTDKLVKDDFVVSSMHGDMTQPQRQLIMKEFRSGATRVLIATDLLARGIDVQGVSLVINYDLPKNRENYIHRIGRGGRFGRKGSAINFVTDEDETDLRQIEEFYNTQIAELPKDLAELE